MTATFRTTLLSFSLQERLEYVNEQFIDRTNSRKTQEKILKRKVKREWIKRKKERQKKEGEETMQRREQLNMLIDDERDIIRRNELLRKTVRKSEKEKKNSCVCVYIFQNLSFICLFFLQHQEAKLEADVVLSEIRRKRSEVTRISQVLNSLRELRSLRARSLESRCALFSKQEDTDNFNSKLGETFFFNLTVVVYKYRFLFSL